MPTHHSIVGKCNRSGTREYRIEKFHRKKLTGTDHFWKTERELDFNLKILKILGSEHFWKMRSGKGARDCSESSISYKNRKKLSLSEHFWKMRLEKGARDCSESSVSSLQSSWPPNHHVSISGGA